MEVARSTLEAFQSRENSDLCHAKAARFCVGNRCTVKMPDTVVLATLANLLDVRRFVPGVSGKQPR
jgi:hypothetical protein